MKIIHYAECETAIPRKNKIGLLIFNHAFFIGKSETIGVEITIYSLRWKPGYGIRRVWFAVNRWKTT